MASFKERNHFAESNENEPGGYRNSPYVTTAHLQNHFLVLYNHVVHGTAKMGLEPRKKHQLKIEHC